MLHTEDLSQVPDQGEIPDEGPYLVRVSEVQETNESGEPLTSDKGAPKVVFVMKIQDEGKAMGFPLRCHASLQPHALFNLKAIYNAAGYKPGPEGHDPSAVLDSQFYVYVKHKMYKGENDTEARATVDLPTWGYRSVSQGPAQPRSK